MSLEDTCGAASERAAVERRRDRLVIGVCVVLGLCQGVKAPGAITTPDRVPRGEIRLWKQVDITRWPGTFLCLGDLDNDRRVDFLLYYMGPNTTPGRLIALDHDGKKIWESGNRSLHWHVFHGPDNEPPCRGVCTIYDIDNDGKSEVITEIWRDGSPMLEILDGASGRVERSVESPITNAIRLPAGIKNTRPTPLALIARLHGRKKPPSIVLKIDDSATAPPHVFALDSKLNLLWHVAPKITGVGHIPTAADLDDDGRDELIFGELCLDGEGKTVFEKDFGGHADATDAARLLPGRAKQVILSFCGSTVYCLNNKGEVLWTKGKEVQHGQFFCTGDFVADEPGLEVMVLASGHFVGDYLTCRGSDGATLARFPNSADSAAYPDSPGVVSWQSPRLQALWVTTDRVLYDGRGKVVQTLGPFDEMVREALKPSSRWYLKLSPQVFALDLCGDARQEMVLYQPYDGKTVFIFTQPGSDGRAKKYAHQPGAYNIRNYY